MFAFFLGGTYSSWVAPIIPARSSQRQVGDRRQDIRLPKVAWHAPRASPKSRVCPRVVSSVNKVTKWVAPIHDHRELTTDLLKFVPKTKSILLSAIRLFILPVKLKKTFECHFSITVAKNVSDDCGPVK